MNKKNPKKYAVLVYELVVNLTAFFLSMKLIVKNQSIDTYVRAKGDASFYVYFVNGIDVLGSIFLL